jgi:hypothetical protein
MANVRSRRRVGQHAAQAQDQLTIDDMAVHEGEAGEDRCHGGAPVKACRKALRLSVS